MWKIGFEDPAKAAAGEVLPGHGSAMSFLKPPPELGSGKFKDSCAHGDDVYGLVAAHDDMLLEDMKRELNLMFLKHDNEILWTLPSGSDTEWCLDDREAVFDKALTVDLKRRTSPCSSATPIQVKSTVHDGTHNREGMLTNPTHFIWRTHKGAKNYAKIGLSTDVTIVRDDGRKLIFELKRVTASTVVSRGGVPKVLADMPAKSDDPTVHSTGYGVYALTLEDMFKYVWLEQVAPFLIASAQSHAADSSWTHELHTEAAYIGVAIKPRDQDFLNATVHWSNRYTLADLEDVFDEAGLIMVNKATKETSWKGTIERLSTDDTRQVLLHNVLHGLCAAIPRSLKYWIKTDKPRARMPFRAWIAEGEISLLVD